MMDKNIPIIVLGSGGHAKVLIETLRENQIPIVGVTSLTLNPYPATLKERNYLL